MESMIWSMAGVALALCLLLAGVRLGRRAERTGRRERPQAENGRAGQRLEEEQKAFSDLMGYNAERAYGMAREEEPPFGEEE